MPKKLIVNGIGELDTVLDQTAEEVAITPVGDISSTDLQSAIAELDSEKIAVTEKAAANGVATLDANTTVPLSQLPAAVFGGPKFIGTWDADTNTPDLSALTPNQGDYYRVQIAGSTLLDGESDWGVGDWAIYNGTAWDRIDNSESVTSVNGKEGVVTLNTDEIPEATALYHTDARAQTAAVINSTAGAETNQAPSVNAIKSYVMDASNLGAGNVDNTELSTLNGVTSSVQTQLDSKIPASEKASANGVATLDASGTVPDAQLPVSVQDVFEVADFDSLPAVGLPEKIYTTLDNNKIFRWNGSSYDELSASNNNIALIGKGTATWNLASGSDLSVAASSDVATFDFNIPSMTEVGYTFTSTQNGPLHSARIGLRRVASQNDDGNVRLRLYATSGGVPVGPVLDESSTRDTSLINTFGIDESPTLTFSQSVDLVSGTEYFMAIFSTDTGTIRTLAEDDEPTSQNFIANTPAPPEWVLTADQRTIFHDVIVGTDFVGGLVLSEDSFISVPGLENEFHTIQAQSISLPAGGAAYVELDRSSSTAQNVTVQTSAMASVPDSRDIVIIAREQGGELHLGITDPQTFLDGETKEVQRSDLNEERTTRALCRVTRSGSIVQSPSSATIAWDVVTYDTTSSFNTTGAVFTAPRDGFYTIRLQITVLAPALTSAQDLIITVNCSVVSRGDYLVTTSTITSVMHEATLSLTAGDAVTTLSNNNQSSNTINDQTRNFLEISEQVGQF